MKYLKYVSLIFVGFLFTGCFAPVPMNFKSEYINYNLKKNLKKVENEKIVIEPTYEVFVKKPTSFKGGARTIEVQGVMNDKTLAYFFSQYFRQIKVNNSEIGFLNIKSEIKDFTYSNDLQGGMTFTITLNIEVKKDGKVILNKKYVETPPDGVVIIFTLRELSPFEFNNEDLHKGLLWIYETKFKPDLIKALDENM